MLENILRKIKNALMLKWWTVNYRGLRIKLSYNPRKGICEVCGIKCMSSRHHWRYAFSKHEVLQNNKLALKYTNEMCFPDHELGNALRKLFFEDPDMRIISKNKKINKLLELRIKALGDDI